jgi:AcrR family transcriptional regulator
MLDNPKRDRIAERRQAIRVEIIDAAWRVAHEKGIAAFTLRDVAERIGMRAPSLYTHFDSKMAIVDAMFGQAWSDYLAVITDAEASFPSAPREVLAGVARTFSGFAVADLERHQLMNKPVIPGFTPSADSYAPAIEAMGRLEATLGGLGLHDAVNRDLFTAILGGVIDRQLANDPGGDRWLRLLDRAVDMYADYFGLPGPPLSEQT